MSTLGSLELSTLALKGTTCVNSDTVLLLKINMDIGLVEFRPYCSKLKAA